jgi:hypothetical protein
VPLPRRTNQNFLHNFVTEIPTLSSGTVSSKSDQEKNSLRRDELTKPRLSVATDSSRLKFKIRQTLKIKSSAVAAVNESKFLQTLP